MISGSTGSTASTGANVFRWRPVVVLFLGMGVSLVPMLPLLPKMNFPMDAPPDKALAEFLFFCRIRGRGKVKFSLWLLRVKRTDKVDKVDVAGRPHLSGIPCQPACPRNVAGTGMRADGDGGQAGRNEIDFIDLIDRLAGSTSSILSTLSKKRRRFRHEGQCPCQTGMPDPH